MSRLKKLLQYRTLTRNTIWNFLGQGLPLVAAFFAIPLLVTHLGVERFGVLTLLWIMIGYASIFDFGLGRALTQLTAVKLGSNKDDEVPELARTALTLMLILGTIAALAVGFLAPWITVNILGVSKSLRVETTNALYFVAASLPFVIVTIGLRGILEAYQRFDYVNAIRIPIGILTYLGPLIVLPFTTDLQIVVLVLFVGRFITTLAHVVLCWCVINTSVVRYRFTKQHLKPLLSFGSWMTVSNIVAPLMLYMDRFLIASILSASIVAFYTTPYEIITRLWIVPGAIMGALFPILGMEIRQNPVRARFLYHQSLKYISALLLPIAIVVILFAKQGLTFWLGAEFAENSFQIAQLLVIGVVLNSLAQSSATVIQAAGRPDITAKLHLIELIPYVAYVYYFITMYGIIGAAVAWVIRVALSNVVLGFLAYRLLRKSYTQSISAIS